LHLASELSLPAFLQRIVELAAEVTDARYGALGVLGPDGTIIEFVTHGVTAQQRAHIGALPVGRGLLGALITDARPLRTREISQDPRSVGFPPNHPEMHSFLGAPVKARGRVFGNVYLTEKQGAEEFSDEDEEALVILAAQAGVAVQNAHLHEEARQRERRLEAVREISASILEGDGRSRILHLVAERARELMAASVATVAIPAEDPSELVLEVAVGEGADPSSWPTRRRTPGPLSRWWPRPWSDRPCSFLCSPKGSRSARWRWAPPWAATRSPRKT
jgi:GAF domain-containing protein